MKQHYIIGSRWMKTLFPDNEKIQKRCKDSADFDVLIDEEPTEEIKAYFKEMYGSKTELHYIPVLWSWASGPMRRFESELDFPAEESFLRNILFTLKCSHASFDKVHKKKTLYDIYLMNEVGCEVIEPLFWKLFNFWSEKHPTKWRADFTKESSDFFDDAVSREHVHDELHETVKIFDQPAFRFLQEPGQTTAWVCPDKFSKLPKEKQMAVIIEESRVLAIERELSQPKGIQNQYIAYLKWLEAMIDRIAPEWQIPFICNNYHELVNIKEKYYEQKQTLQLN